MAMLQKLMPGFKPIPPETRMTDWRIFIATWFGAGRLRPAPGTMGSLAAIPFGLLIAEYAGIPGLIVATIAVLVIGTMAADFYGKKSGVADDQTIVVDEVAGMWIAAIPAENHWELWFYAFILFRMFDVYKPWPASWFDNRSSGGFDVMMDDVIAGIYASFGVATLALIYM